MNVDAVAMQVRPHPAYVHTGQCGVLVLACALACRVDLLCERYVDLAQFAAGVGALCNEDEVEHARLHFEHKAGPLDVVSTARFMGFPRKPLES